MPIHFVPFAQDPATVVRYYQAADVYLHPAKAENFPLAVLEAMACSLPVVASDAGGIPEIVVHGETGYLFENGDPKSLAAAATLLLEDTTLLQGMAASGRERIVRLFAFPLQSDRYLEWYNSLR